MSVKTCTKCGVEKELEQYSRKKDGKYGRMAYCKECNSAKCRAYYEENREKENARARSYGRAYREAHRNERNAYNRAYGRERRAMMGNPNEEKWQEISKKYATRSDLWSEAEDNYLASSTGRAIDDALALQRTYRAVKSRIQHLRRQGITLARDEMKAAA